MVDGVECCVEGFGDFTDFGEDLFPVGKDDEDVFVDEVLCSRVVNLFVNFDGVHLLSVRIAVKGGVVYEEIASKGTPEDFFKEEGFGARDDAGDVSYCEGRSV